jgi:mono/diheme cytochrome c family protein
MSVTRGALAFVVVAGVGCAIGGIGMGEAPAERAAAPDAAEVAAAKRRIAAGGASVRRGRELFAAQGCDRCHSIAATGAEGRLGPRLDTLDEDLDDNLESIVEPRHDIADGYPSELMPADFDARLDDAELRALSAFVTAASGGTQDGGRGRGRGRSGED